MTDTLIPDREQATSELAEMRLRTDLSSTATFAGSRRPRFVSENPRPGSDTEVAEAALPMSTGGRGRTRRRDSGVWSRLDPAARKRILLGLAT